MDEQTIRGMRNQLNGLRYRLRDAQKEVDNIRDDLQFARADTYPDDSAYDERVDDLESDLQVAQDDVREIEQEIYQLEGDLEGYEDL